jgi:hypothetical protein
VHPTNELASSAAPWGCNVIASESLPSNDAGRLQRGTVDDRVASRGGNTMLPQGHLDSIGCSHTVIYKNAYQTARSHAQGHIHVRLISIDGSLRAIFETIAVFSSVSPWLAKNVCMKLVDVAHS